ncbi:response regulator transcription factor [Ornithinibacillus scapharcae]|uniref:response regulator transcription factor n=1 Tax=Ornithinibacillus scapharcae TaxID=1147159 RepID=UPI000225B8F9|nr:response regulator transcription factor [Ornithinibacillus scapharcae]
MARVLYLEDERDIGEWVLKDLTSRGHDVKWLTSGEGMDAHLSETDIVILDVMLPGLDGFSLGRRIKKDYQELPIIMLSARTSVEDKIEGLDFADDYVTKPFHPDELAARLEVLLRRFQKQDEVLELQHLLIYLKDGIVIDRESEMEIPLTGKQYHLFQFFIKHINQILTKEQLYEGVWGERYIEGDKTLMVHIRYLREKIEKNPASPTIIQTIRGIGYRVKA